MNIHTRARIVTCVGILKTTNGESFPGSKFACTIEKVVHLWELKVIPIIMREVIVLEGNNNLRCLNKANFYLIQCSPAYLLGLGLGTSWMRLKTLTLVTSLAPKSIIKMFVRFF